MDNKKLIEILNGDSNEEATDCYLNQEIDVDREYTANENDMMIGLVYRLLTEEENSKKMLIAAKLACNIDQLEEEKQRYLERVRKFDWRVDSALEMIPDED